MSTSKTCLLSPYFWYRPVRLYLKLSFNCPNFCTIKEGWKQQGLWVTSKSAPFNTYLKRDYSYSVCIIPHFENCKPLSKQFVRVTVFQILGLTVFVLDFFKHEDKSVLTENGKLYRYTIAEFCCLNQTESMQKSHSFRRIPHIAYKTVGCCEQNFLSTGGQN